MSATHDLVTAVGDSSLALRGETVEPGEAVPLRDDERDALVYVSSGSGRLALGADEWTLQEGSAALILAGEDAALASADASLELVIATVDPDADRHAPMGARETVVASERTGAESASSARAFQIFFGPHNGSTRATFFAGFIPPGRAPWHYHLYDEIVWVPDGPGRLHVGETTTELGRGAAFRLRPRQVHIVENLSPDAEMTIIGVFTPAGSPSAAYLTLEIAAEYRFAD